jgi:hypothetical protein
MRQILFSLAAVALSAVAAVAQQPAAPVVPVPAAQAQGMAAPHGMMAVPTAPAQAAPAPVAVVAPGGCGTPAAVGGCSTCDAGPRTRQSLMSRLGFTRCGTANSTACSSLASERTFLFGSCKSFFNPCRTCDGTAIEYGPGGQGNKDNCRGITSFHSR